MKKRKTAKENLTHLYNVGDIIRRYSYQKNIKRKVVITGFIDCVEITRHKNPFLDKCYHIVWSNGTQGWWCEKTLKDHNIF